MLDRRVKLFVGTGLAYAAGSLIAYWWFDALGIGPSFFPPAGVTLGMLVSTSRRDWPWILAGAAVAEITIDTAQGLGAGLTIGYAAANVVEPLVGASLIRSRLERVDLGRRRDLLIFLTLGVAAAPVVGAVIAATAYEVFAAGGWFRFASHWWIGDGLGVLVVGGSILAWRSPTPPRTRRHLVEVAGFMAATLAATIVVVRFESVVAGWVIVVLLGLAAFRTGARGVALAGCVLSFTVATAAAQGADVYTGLGYAPDSALVYLQTSIALILGIALLLAAEITERDLATLARSREESLRHHAEEHASREHAVAMALQHSLMGPMDVETDAVSITSFYRAGVDDMQAGGDWHDVIDLPDGSVGIAVGDVLGRGLKATTAMGQLRVAMAALAPAHPSPATLIDELERFARRIEGAEMGTVAFARLAPSTGTLRYACAGHPPPLLVEPGGKARFLWDGRSRPIGVAIPRERSDGTVTLDPGSTLILYSDGLVERRGEPLDRGLERLRSGAAAGASGTAGPHDIRDEITLRLLAGSSGEDDVAMVVMQLIDGRPTFHRSLGGMGPPTRLRNELRAWIDARGIDPPIRDELVLAVWETVANGMEHGEATDGKVTISIAMDPSGELVAQVTDRGRWKPPTPHPSRGHGLRLVRGLMDEVEIDADDHGTRVTMRRRLKVGATPEGAPSG